MICGQREINKVRSVNYTESFKINAVQKLLSSKSGTLKDTADKVGVPVSTLYGWKAKYANIDNMTKSKKNKNYSPEQKLEILIKTSSMTESELGAYLRSEGLLSSELELFKSDLISSVPTKGRPKLDPEVVSLRSSVKNLSKDLKKTQRALAEQSARIILLKKSHEIWGVPEDDE